MDEKKERENAEKGQKKQPFRRAAVRFRVAAFGFRRGILPTVL